MVNLYKPLRAPASPHSCSYCTISKFSLLYHHCEQNNTSALGIAASQESQAKMKLFATVLLLAVTAVAAIDIEPRAGCSQPGEYCNDGTFLCCSGNCDTANNVVCYTLPWFPLFLSCSWMLWLGGANRVFCLVSLIVGYRRIYCLHLVRICLDTGFEKEVGV